MKLISKSQAAALIGLHPESLNRLVRENRFPRPIKTHPSRQGRVRFDEAELLEWLAARKAERPQTAGGAQ